MKTKLLISILSFLILWNNSIFAESWFLNPIALKQDASELQYNFNSDTIVLNTGKENKHLYKLLPTNPIPLGWEFFSQTNDPFRGNLLEKSMITKKLSSLGITQSSKILVIGDSIDGWGEEGRIVWMLRSHGYKYSYILDGGWKALELLDKNSLPKSNSISSHKPSGDSKKGNKNGHLPFTEYTANTTEVKNSLSDKKTVFLDTREEREYLGAVPYGEIRGGHLPGARHIHFKEFMDKNGFLLPAEQIERILRAKGITKDKKIISYCTGGVRSAWVTSVLVSLGYEAKNYPGSMWEWSGYPSESHPLEIIKR